MCANVLPRVCCAPELEDARQVRGEKNDRTMDLSEQAYGRFVDLIYEAAEHPARWGNLYQELQAGLGVRSVHMLSCSRGAGMSDPFLAPPTALREGEWLHVPELLAPEAPRFNTLCK